jgi:thioredoxin-like negative regulator of GroEL
MMTRISRILLGLVTPCCAVLLCGLQAANPEPERELAAGKLAAEQGAFEDAATHFNQANQLRDNKCSECYVWLARIDMAAGRLDQALTQIEKGVTTAVSGPELASAQLYRGLILGRQGDLARAEAAFKAASSANPGCLECRFNLGFVLLKESKDAEGVEVLKTIASEFSGTPRGREIQRFIADPSRIRKNYAPEFSAKLRSGDEINLDSLKGKVVLLDFWGTWCGACRVSLPLLKELAARADPAKVAIISIDEADPRQKWEQFIQDNGMTWSQIYDGNRSLYRTFGVDAFPRYFILSRDGIILEQFKGWNQDGKATISDAIARALAQ